MKNIILMTKLKNAINAKKPGMNFHLHNININGVKRGCSGFIENPVNGSIIYVNTENSLDHLMYRYADHVKDFTGYHNRWATSYEEFIISVCQCLNKTPIEVGDHRI